MRSLMSDFEQFSDTHRSAVMIMYMFQMRTIHIHQIEEYSNEVGTVENSDDEQNYNQIQQLGPLKETNAVLLPPLVGTGAAAKLCKCWSRYGRYGGVTSTVHY